MNARRVSAKRIAQINDARLDSVAGVQMLRAADKDASLRQYVHSSVRSDLFHLMVKADVIGMPRDEILAEIEDYLHHAAKMQSPVMPVLEFIELQLDLRLEQHHADRIALGASREAIHAQATSGGNARGIQIAKDAASDDETIKRLWRAYRNSDDLQFDYETVAAYIQAESNFSRSKVYARLKSLGLQSK